MTEQTEGAEVAQVLALLPTCTQCGKRFAEPACGMAHAIIASDPLRHRLFEPLLAADRAAAEARGAERALREAAADGPLHFAATHTGREARGWNVIEAAWLSDRADRIAAAARAAATGGDQ